MGKKTKTATPTGVITLNEASEVLSDLLVELYNAKVFVRVGKDFADMAFKNGFDGGALVSSIPLLTERQVKISTANEAILKLNQMLYILNAMVKAGLYEDTMVAKVKSYATEIIEALKEMLSNVSKPQRKITVVSPINVKSIKQRVVTPVYESLPETTIYDDDGLDDYTELYPEDYNTAVANDIK